MALAIGIGFDPEKDVIYLGVEVEDKPMTKKDITSEFIQASFAYFEEGSIREIQGKNEGVTNLFINIRNDKKSISALLMELLERLD